MRDKRTLKNLLVLAITTVVVLLGVWGVQSLRSGSGSLEAGEVDGVDGVTPVEIESAVPLEVGRPAPSFKAVTIDGEEVDVGEFEGKPLWLVFNATWCADCRAEIPDVIEAFETREDVQILSVYVSDSARAVMEYSQNLGIPYPQVVDDDHRISAAYGVVGVPTNVFIGSDGTVESVQVGALSASAIATELDNLR